MYLFGLSMVGYSISRFTASGTSAHKGNSKFEILVVKILSLKQKTKSNAPSCYRKNQIFTLQENMVPLDKGLQ